MSIPFGFSSGDDSNDELGAFFENLGRSMRNAGASQGHVDWESVKKSSSRILKSEGDPAIDSVVHNDIEQATELAQLWINEATSFPSNGEHSLVTKRSEWITSTFETWQSIVEPVASGLAQAMTSLIPNDLEQGNLAIPDELLSQLPPEIAQQMQDMISNGDFTEMLKPMIDMARSMSATMFGNQFGEHLGWMSTAVLSSTDIGLPLSNDTKPDFIGENVKEFCDGLGAASQDAYIYIALRELAHQRLFTYAPWLLTQVQSALAAYASEAKIDTSQIEEVINSIDPSNIDALNDELSLELSLEDPTEEQRAAIARIELLLAFIEGWVTTVVLDAAGSRLPHATALEETFRRRRAAGGPAERFFKGLIGLQLHPRSIREATAMWKRITEAIGIQERDQLWSHPDLLPTAEDIDNVDDFVQRSSHDLMTDLHRAMNSEIPAPPEGDHASGDDGSNN